MGWNSLSQWTEPELIPGTDGSTEAIAYISNNILDTNPSQMVLQNASLVNTPTSDCGSITIENKRIVKFNVNLSSGGHGELAESLKNPVIYIKDCIIETDSSTNGNKNAFVIYPTFANNPTKGLTVKFEHCLFKCSKNTSHIVYLQYATDGSGNSVISNIKNVEFIDCKFEGLNTESSNRGIIKTWGTNLDRPNLEAGTPFSMDAMTLTENELLGYDSVNTLVTNLSKQSFSYLDNSSMNYYRFVADSVAIGKIEKE